MLKTLMVTTAIGGLMIGSALAEGAPQTPAPSMRPSQMTPNPVEKKSTDTPAPAAKSTENKSTEMKAPAANTAAPKFVNSQRQDQYLASNFKGTDVIGTDDKKIGDVSDILFDKDGKIEAYVVGVGGFLGVGAKDVALAPSAFQIVPGDKSKNESDKLKLSMTQEELKSAANFEPYKAPSSTTGMGGASRPMGGTAPGSAAPPR
jgi:sporulation protein YlmC with PRC-barrel domain